MGVYFLAAGRSSRNRERTLDRGHHLDEIVALLRSHEADQLRALVPQDEPVYLWGANKEGDLPRLKAGDYVVDVKNKAVLQVFRYCLYLQTDDTRLQEHVGWDAEKSPDERRPYRFVFFLRSPLQTNRSDKAYFQAAFGELANQNWLVGQRYFNDEDIVRACEKTRNLTIESLLGISADSDTQSRNGDFQSDEFLRVMRRYKTEGVVFQTPVESHRYSVESVDADGALIRRIDGSDPSRATVRSYQDLVERIRADGGEIGYSDSPGTISNRMAQIQGNSLALIPGENRIVVTDTLDKVAAAFVRVVRNLNVDVSGGSPKLYKPAVLAAVVEAISTEELKENRITFDWVSPRALSVLRSHEVDDVDEKQIAYAFAHLRRDQLWMLCYADPAHPLDAVPSPANLRSKVSHATLRDSFWEVLQHAEQRETIRAALESVWFAGSQGSAGPAIWWVNQGKTYRAERSGGYVWAPTQTKQGTAVGHHTNVSRLKAGDIVVHYADGEIAALGSVRSAPDVRSRPSELPSELWGDEGHYAEVRYFDLEEPIKLTEISGRTADVGPFDRVGGVKQGYLWELNDEFTLRLKLDHAARWPAGSPWAGMTDLAKLVARFKAESDYENDYHNKRRAQKAELGAHLTEAALDEPDTSGLRRLGAAAYGGPGQQAHFFRLLKDEDGPERVAQTFRHLLYGDGDLADRFDDALDGEFAQPGVKEAILTKVLAVVRNDWLPIYLVKGDRGKNHILEKLGLELPPAGVSVGAAAQIANERLYEALKPHFGDDLWGMMVFGYWLSEDDEPPTSRPSLRDLGRELYLEPVDYLEDIKRLLDDKRQVIFYGPPGTGKTYIARKLADYLAGSPAALEKVQFHPSYSYEDFIEGYRPQLIDNQASFRLVGGPLRRLASRAEQHDDETHVLLIDEINRGNLSKIFGELFYLLEYRDDELTLQYSDEPFSLPGNVWFICTMNTADRSIALVDAALRRRFHFVPFFPDKAPIEGLLRRYLTDKKPEMAWVADVVDAANALLGDRHAAIGPSHFLRADLTEDKVKMIWTHSVQPYLEDQLIDDPSQLVRYDLDRLRSGSEGRGDSNEPESAEPTIEEPGA